MKYSIILEGRNFEVIIDGKVKNMGFYTTRIVKADSIEEAEDKAIHLIKTDQSLINIMVKESVLEPVIEVDSVYKASWWKRTGGKGYTFYPMGGE
ncbi:MAG: hypothetical protein OEZ39_11955 [Gammaproteobacteria bacterium]|nr:hypothetical protein [Gammaproteobacteria bacterium]MDH5652557.1 hypothetical protein [Gammaproteobacteria bacterium]